VPLKAAARKLALNSIAVLDKRLGQLVVKAAPALVATKDVGTDIAATLLTVTGDNPERLSRRVLSPTWSEWRH
jgi:hypothetical protein